MKKLLFVVAVFAMTSVSAQFYVSGSVGYAIGSAGVKMGEIETDTSIEATYGSYGEGMNSQLRVGYFFNDTFGVDLGVGYLHGADQTLKDFNRPSTGQTLKIIGRGRAFGIMPSLVYKFSDHIYGRVGALIKIGGKTEVKGSASAFLPNGTLPSVPADALLKVDFTRDFHGQLPLGATAAFGYKRSIGQNLEVFVEAEYMGISVRRKDAELSQFSGTLTVAGKTSEISRDGLLQTIASSPALSANPNIQTLAILISDKTNYVDSKGNSPSATEFLADTVPYSSFGINFGITYTFGKSSKK